MNRFIRGLALTTALTFAAAPAWALESNDLVALQAAMQSHIDAVTIDGAVLNFVAAEGKAVPLYPSKAHPKIMTMGAHFVMCADFVDAAGNAVMANFYMAKNESGYVVYHTTFGPDAALEAMMKDGKVAMAN
jgi:hypothetical protein